MITRVSLDLLDLAQCAASALVPVNLVLTPVLAVSDELEVLAAQGMERMRHPDASVPIVRNNQV